MFCAFALFKVRSHAFFFSLSFLSGVCLGSSAHASCETEVIVSDWKNEGISAFVALL